MLTPTPKTRKTSPFRPRFGASEGLKEGSVFFRFSSRSQVKVQHKSSEFRRGFWWREYPKRKSLPPKNPMGFLIFESGRNLFTKKNMNNNKIFRICFTTFLSIEVRVVTATLCTVLIWSPYIDRRPYLKPLYIRPPPFQLVSSGKKPDHFSRVSPKFRRGKRLCLTKPLVGHICFLCTKTRHKSISRGLSRVSLAVEKRKGYK